MSAQELATIIVGLVVLLILLFLYWNCRCRSEPTSTPRWPRDRQATMDVEQAPKTSNNDSSRSRLEVTKVKTDGGQAPKEQNNDPSPSQKNKVTKVKMGGGQNPKEQNNDPSPSQKNKVTEVKTDGGQAPKEQKHDPSPSKKIKVKEVKTDGGQAPKEQNNDPSPSPSQENKVNEAKTDGGQAPKEQNNDPSPSLSQNNKVNKAKTDGGQAPKEQNNDPSPSQSQKNKVNEDKTDGGQAPKEQNNDPSPSPSQKNKVTEAKTDGEQAPKEQNNDPSPSQKNNVKEAKTDGGQASKKQNDDPSLSQKNKLTTFTCFSNFPYSEQVPKEQNNDPSPSQKNKDKMNGGQAEDSQWNAPPRSDHGLQMGSSSSGPDTSLTCPRPGIAFDYPTLAKATNWFSDDNFLGKGGFGPVHKGVVTIDKEGVLPFDKEIAVKQLNSQSQQGNAEFEAEVKIISRVHHRHLVTLLGHCISGEQRLLVYEFVPNNTLHFHLHGKDQPAMELSTRLKIALGSARGLAYLHEDCNPTIIHRDIKAANILLDSKFEPKVADFGLARFAYDYETHVLTSKLKGTFGYFAPEYANSGKLSDKSDVYAFGVMLLELITGRLPVDRRPSNNNLPVALVNWAKPRLTLALEEGNYDPLVDPWLLKDNNRNEMKWMVACAAACVRHSAKRRPRMSLVVQVLRGVVSPENLNDGVPPMRTGRT